MSEALNVMHRGEERYCEAELYRLQGELTLQTARSSADRRAIDRAAEADFQRAIAIARGQQSKSLELRAVMSLCRLYADQGREQEGYPMLVGVYRWFTEGFDTPDLQDAKMWLETLSRAT